MKLWWTAISPSEFFVNTLGAYFNLLIVVIVCYYCYCYLSSVVGLFVVVVEV